MQLISKQVNDKIILFLKQLNYGVILIWDLYLYPERKQESSMADNLK